MNRGRGRNEGRKGRMGKEWVEVGMEYGTEEETNHLNTHTHTSLRPTHINKQILFYLQFNYSMAILNFKSVRFLKG